MQERGKGLPTLHTTLDSGINSDACKGLTEQGTNHSQEMELVCPFCSLSVWAFLRYRLDVRWSCSLPAEEDSTDSFPFYLTSAQLPNLSIPVCFKDLKTSLEAQSVPQLFLFSLGTKVNMCHHPKEMVCFSLLRYSK